MTGRSRCRHHIHYTGKRTKGCICPPAESSENSGFDAKNGNLLAQYRHDEFPFDSRVEG
jgi:hypothetical protein